MKVFRTLKFQTAQGFGYAVTRKIILVILKYAYNSNIEYDNLNPESKYIKTPLDLCSVLSFSVKIIWAIGSDRRDQSDYSTAASREVLDFTSSSRLDCSNLGTSGT